eukprot:TRINITY_DN16227_c0_g1_i1.p1 TRINITY_DN16227_c0_g1~~TRINITY_DN16227_c0_g1_i1.p1  ORF type:complete len:243 (+),score=43.13 TRINITY_DN16227_c0_g1_i1:76-729(+)
MAPESPVAESLNLHSGGSDPALNRALSRERQHQQDIILAEFLGATQAVAEQDTMQPMVMDDMQTATTLASILLLYAEGGFQDADEDTRNPGGISDLDGYAPDCSCDDDDHADDATVNNLSAWCNAGLRNSQLSVLESDILLIGSSPDGIAGTFASGVENVFDPDSIMPEDDGNGEDVVRELASGWDAEVYDESQSSWWNPGGIPDADRAYAPSCPCD